MMKRMLAIAGCLALTLAVAGAQNRPEDNIPAPRKPAARSAQPPPRVSAPALGAGVGRAYYQRRSVEPTVRGYGLAQPTFRETSPRMSRTPSRTTGATLANRTAASPGTATSTLQSGKTSTTGGTRTFTPRHFDLPKTTSQPVTGAKFTPGSHIPGSENWKGSSFAAFRNYRPQWHDANWWRRHHDRIVVVIINNFPSFFFFDAGFWFPAWGYNPYSIYPYDGPVYAYDDLPPDQVIANVQAALADQGYYDGPIDGVLGPLTRAAIALYQQDHGLYVTSAVDEPTLASLGMV